MGLDANLRTSRLHLITPITGSVADFTHFIDGMFRAGVDVIQVRAAQGGAALTEAAQQELLEAGRQIAFPQSRLIAIGRDVAAAEKFQADLLHLGASDGDLGEARAKMHQYARVGRSVHRAESLAPAAAEADYLFVGPAFGTDAPGLDLVRAAAQALPVADPASTPWVAVGGITPENLPQVLEAGAVRVAVSSGVLAAADPFQAAADMAQQLRDVWNSRGDLQTYSMQALGGGAVGGVGMVLGAPGFNAVAPADVAGPPEGAPMPDVNPQD